MHFPMGQFAFARFPVQRCKGDRGIKQADDGNHQPARDRPERRLGGSVGKGAYMVRCASVCLQDRRGDFQAPGEQEDHVHPAIIAPEAPAKRLAIAHQEGRPAQAFGNRRRPVGREACLRAQHFGEISSLDLAYARPVDIEEAVAPCLDEQQERHQQHGEQKHAVMRCRRRQRHRQKGCDHRDRPVRGPVDAVAPARHAAHLAAIIVDERADRFRGCCRQGWALRLGVVLQEPDRIEFRGHGLFLRSECHAHHAPDSAADKCLAGALRGISGFYIAKTAAAP